MIDPRLGCSTISFRRLTCGDALSAIAGLGFAETDLGSLPGICDHVPFALDRTARTNIVAAVTRHGLAVRSINADIGDLNMPVDSDERRRRAHQLAELAELAAEVGATALVLPNGALSHQPNTTLATDLDTVAGHLRWASSVARAHDVQLWVETLHVFRLCCTLDRAAALAARIDDPTIGHVLDASHVVASGANVTEAVERFAGFGTIAHVHLRDATRGALLDGDDPVRPGDINRSIGNGVVAFAALLNALESVHFAGHFSLELETHDVEDDKRAATAAEAGAYITRLLGREAVSHRTQ